MGGTGAAVTFTGVGRAAFTATLDKPGVSCKGASTRGPGEACPDNLASCDTPPGFEIESASVLGVSAPSAGVPCPVAVAATSAVAAAVKALRRGEYSARVREGVARPDVGLICENSEVVAAVGEAPG